MLKYFLFTLICLNAVCASAQTTAYQWYKKAMLHLAEPGQIVLVDTKVNFADGREKMDTYKYGLNKQNFYASFTGKDIFLTKDWFINLDKDNGVILIDKNKNEGSSQKRLSDIIDQFNGGALQASEPDTKNNNFSISEHEKGLKKITIKYPNASDLFSEGFIVFDAQSLEIKYGQFIYASNNVNRNTAYGEIESVSFSYVFTKFKPKEFLNINDVLQMNNDLIELMPPYDNFRVYNMSGMKIKG